MSDDLGSALAAPEIAPAPAPEAPAPEQSEPEAPAPKAEAKAEPKTLAETIKASRDKVFAKDAVSERPRDEQGRFAKADEPAMPDPKPPVQQPPKAAEAAPDKPADPNARQSAFDPPARFTPDAKAAWNDAPPAVKAEVNRAITELESGLQQYQQRWEPIKRYDELARQVGTTVDKALERYTALEMALSTDPQSAIQEIFQYAKVNPHEWASQILGTQPDVRVVQYEHALNNAQSQLAQASQQIEQLNAQIAQIEQERVMGEINSFKANAPRFEELQAEMVRMLETGYASDLKDAYEKADRLNPAAAPQPTPAPVPQPPKRAVQISGAPNAGSNPAVRKPSSTLQESIRRAASQTGVRV